MTEVSTLNLRIDDSHQGNEAIVKLLLNETSTNLQMVHLHRGRGVARRPTRRYMKILGPAGRESHSLIPSVPSSALASAHGPIRKLGYSLFFRCGSHTTSRNGHCNRWWARWSSDAAACCSVYCSVCFRICTSATMDRQRRSASVYM